MLAPVSTPLLLPVREKLLTLISALVFSFADSVQREQQRKRSA